MKHMEHAQKLTVYDASGRDRIAFSAWRAMGRELLDYRELIMRLISRNISGQFRQSFLGYVWIALPPIATAVIFSLLRSADIMRVEMPAGAMPYALFALVGATVWGFFTQVTMMATASIANAGSLVSKIYFPREVLVLSAVGNAVINFVIRVAVIAISFVVVGYMPAPGALLAPLLMLPVLALALGLGLIFAPLNTMISDFGRLLEFAFQFGLFLAPTVYPTPSLAEATTHWQQGLFWLHSVNPVSHFMYAINTLIETGSFVPTTGWSVSAVISVLTLLCGWRFFHICEPLLAERL